MSLVLGWISISMLADPASAAERRLTCDQVPGLIRQFLQKHIDFHYLNEELRARAVDSYIERIDPSKTLFLKGEVRELRQDLLSVFLDIRAGDCSRLATLQADIVKRYEKMQAFVTQLVQDENYAVDPSVQLVIDPKKRGHPLDEEERTKLYTKLVHFQVSNYLSNDIELEEAKGKLVHRYEISTRRAVEFEEEDIYSLFLNSFAAALDPHSNYLSREAMEDFQIGMGLSLEGIGVALSSRDGFSIVEKIIPGGAADSLNVLEPKDKIIAVAQEDGEFVDIIDMDLRDVVRLIRGKRGTEVHLTVLRQTDTDTRFPITIVRDKINLQEQAAKMRFEEVPNGDETLKLAILELPSFYGGRNPSERQSSRDMRELLEQAKAEKADGLLLDLSRNGGGLLENSVEIAGFFIDQGGIVAVKDTFSKVQILRDPNPGLVYDGPVVVLTSRVSASASEIVAGALKDYGRAIVTGGDHTFGKGTVQSMIQLPTGLGSIKVTTALFFRPGGESTQHSGVSADISLPSRFSTDDYGESYEDYSLPPQRIHSFLELDASRSVGEPAWQPVTPSIIQTLAESAQARIDKNEAFAEIEESLKKTRERDGVLHLAEIIKEREEQAAKDEAEEADDETEANDSEGEKPDDETEAKDPEGDASKDDLAKEDEKDSDSDNPPSPQQLEAIELLADYVRLLNS